MQDIPTKIKIIYLIESDVFIQSRATIKKGTKILSQYCDCYEVAAFLDEKVLKGTKLYSIFVNFVFLGCVGIGFPSLSIYLTIVVIFYQAYPN